MNGQGDIAVRAHHHFPTTAAAQKGAVSTPRDKNNRLFPLVGQGRQTFHQGAADQTPMPVGQFVAHIHHMNRRQRLLGDPMAKTGQCE